MKTSASLGAIFAIVGMMLGVQIVSGANDPDLHEYEITTTWNNETVPENETVSIKFTSAEGGLGIEIKAPFYNDTMPDGEPGRVDGLWEFEVVEVFLLGDNAHYLELEFGPGGHYLVYYLIGVRQPVNITWTLSNYTTHINETDQTWEGHAVVPADYLPPALDKFNAYAIHGINETRKYLSLFPVPVDGKGPDFHNLDPFEPIDLSDLVTIRNSTMSGATSFLVAANNANYLIYFVLTYLLATFVV